LLGLVRPVLGLLAMVIGAAYVLWEIYPTANPWARRRPGMSLLIFAGCGALVGILVWVVVRQPAATPAIPATLTPETAIGGVPPTSGGPSGVTHQEQVVKFDFKAGLFTGAQKERMRREIDSIYGYLTDVGFECPKEMPPLRIGGVAGFVIPGPVYWSSVSINAKDIEDPVAVANVYARFAFRSILHGSDPSRWDSGDREMASWIFGEYFPHGAAGRTPKTASADSIMIWVNAIWDVRKRFGKEFADMAMLYTSKAFDDSTAADANVKRSTSSKEDFDKYFARAFLFGESVSDNNMGNYNEVATILRKRGVMKWATVNPPAEPR